MSKFAQTLNAVKTLKNLETQVMHFGASHQDTAKIATLRSEIKAAGKFLTPSERAMLNRAHNS